MGVWYVLQTSQCEQAIALLLRTYYNYGERPWFRAEVKGGLLPPYKRQYFNEEES